MSRHILATVRRRSSAVGLALEDPALGITCTLNGSRHFYAASVVKVTILAALLRKAQEHHRGLTPKEKARAWKMLTWSDNASATVLWNDTGRSWLHHFLGLARMRHTVLGPDGYWGLTRTTARDESRQLHLLVTGNNVLTRSGRNYELHLMANVIRSQRWGTPAGVPASYQVHVKDAWLPVTRDGWFVHSLGAFTGRGASYTVAVLTGHNPRMSYGIATIEAIARTANHDLAARAGGVRTPRRRCRGPHRRLVPPPPGRRE